MQSGIIKQVNDKSSKDGTKTFYEVVLTNGFKMSTFDEKVKSVIGTEIEFDVEDKGRFKNLKEGWKLKPSSGSEPAKSTGKIESPETRISIENMACMKGIFDLAIGGILPPDSSEYQATLKWAASHFGQPAEKKSQSDKDFEKLESAGKNENLITKAQDVELEKLILSSGRTVLEFGAWFKKTYKWELSKLAELKVWQYEILKKYLNERLNR